MAKVESFAKSEMSKENSTLQLADRVSGDEPKGVNRIAAAKALSLTACNSSAGVRLVGRVHL